MRRRRRFSDKRIEVLHLDVRGTTVSVSVDTNGQFEATFLGKTFYAEKLSDLRAKLLTTSRQKKVRVAIPACQFSAGHSALGGGPSFPAILLTGINVANDNVEWKYDRPGARTEQMKWREECFKPLTATQQIEGIALYKQKKVAEEKWEAFERRHQINPREVVKAAIEKALAEQDDEETTELDADPR